MKLLIVSFCALFLSVSLSVVSAADKVVVVPLGKSVQTVIKTMHYNLPPADFQPVFLTDDTPRANFITGEWLRVSSPQKVLGLTAPVHLPDDAVIKDFHCYVYDNDSNEGISGNSPSFLWRRDLSSTSKELITEEFSMPTLGANELIRDFSTSAVLEPTVDNDDFFYGAYVLYKITNNPGSINNLRFYGCRITYDLDVIVR